MKIKFLFHLFIGISFLFSSSLNVLTYNIHALTPVIAGDDPHSRVPEILSKSLGFEILFLQENWIFNESELQPYLPGYNIILSKNSKFLWPLKQLINPNGAGLSIAISDTIKVIDVVEKSFVRCSGWLSKDNDCLSSKGFQHIIVEVSGERLDLYNTHLDAGSSESDVSTRNSQILHIQNYIKKNSDGYPLIIAGDLNIDYNSNEFSIIMQLNSELDSKIADWSNESSASAFGKLDYILYRDSQKFDLSLESCKVDSELNGLSDHPPIKALFNY